MRKVSQFWLTVTFSILCSRWWNVSYNICPSVCIVISKFQSVSGFCQKRQPMQLFAEFLASDWLNQPLANQVEPCNPGLVRVSIMKNISQVLQSIDIVQIFSPFPIGRTHTTENQLKNRWIFISLFLIGWPIRERFQDFKNFPGLLYQPMVNGTSAPWPVPYGFSARKIISIGNSVLK